MTPNEPQILKDAIAYLQGSPLMSGIYVAPDSQDFPAQFPAVTLLLRTTPAQAGLSELLLSETTIQSNVFAETTMQVLDILITMDVLMEARGYRRTNNTSPYYASGSGKWAKSAWYTKKTNTF